MIAEPNGALVWFHPLPADDSATNFQVQTYDGQPALTWWQGRIIRVGFGEGEDVIYNSSYQQVATVRAGNGYRADLHEILLTPQGTAWIDAFDPIHMNLALRARLRPRDPAGLRNRGDRRQDRPRDVGVARARAHPPRRLAQPRLRGRIPLGLRAHQLDLAWTGGPGGGAGPINRATCCSPRATRGRCTT